MLHPIHLPLILSSDFCSHEPPNSLKVYSLSIGLPFRAFRVFCSSIFVAFCSPPSVSICVISGYFFLCLLCLLWLSNFNVHRRSETAAEWDLLA
jgi:hypothetical protein